MLDRVGGRRVKLGWPRVAIAAWLAVLAFSPDAPATVEEQRARLPPPAACASPVAGTWKALSFDVRQQRWYDLRLEVREDPQDASRLTGKISVDTWEGGASASEPPVPCTGRYRGTMPGSGSFANGLVDFHGGDFTLAEVVCGQFISYNPDRFTGRLEPERQEFQAVNNDGGAAVNEPVVFRRVGCLDDARREGSAVVAPPPFFPKHRSGGC